MVSKRFWLGTFLLVGAYAFAQKGPSPVPSDRGAFVSIEDLDPSIVIEARYSGDHNFVGRPISGYRAPKCLLTRPAAEALVRVQTDLKPFGLGLKVYDCYRPQKAVDDFVAWAKALNDTAMKMEFYPNVRKDRLFSDGYIAERSGHSRGSTVDLTLIPTPAPSQRRFKKGEKLVECFQPSGRRFPDNTLDFGTGYDCFDPLAHTANPKVGESARRNRLMLKAVMEKHGFKNYEMEWWHFTLAPEPFPDTYFTFEVE